MTAQPRPASPATRDAAARKPIVVFCGKGGVGKTTLSLAFGVAHARSDKRVVVVTSHPLPELEATVSLNGLRHADHAAAANLEVIHVDARQILDEMFQGQFPSPILARTVLSSRIYKSLIEVAPGLKEIAFLSRLKELAEKRSRADGRPIDLLVWDAPATGHFLQTLRVARTFDTYFSGPLVDTARQVQRFFSERASFLPVPVTTLEEMAVQETIELCRQISGELGVRPTAIACNLVSPMLSPSPDAAYDAATLPGLSHRAAADLAFVLDRHRIERQQFETLRTALRERYHLVQRVPRWTSDFGLLAAISEQMAALPLDPA